MVQLDKQTDCHRRFKSWNVCNSQKDHLPAKSTDFTFGVFSLSSGDTKKYQVRVARLIKKLP